MANFDIDKTEASTMKGLKDFQRATVERIAHLFRSGQKRVLVADEVGLGKTLIARGVIVKTARMRMEENDEIFKVVYICSNQNIANQNIRKLKVSSDISIEGVSETRLSMQHLKITEQEQNEDIRNGFIQLIPLTPETSFRMTNGGGSVEERALIYAILRRTDFLKQYLKELEELLIYGATKAWNGWVKDNFDKRVEQCHEATRGEYPLNVIDKIDEYDMDKSIKSLLVEHLKALQSNEKKYSDGYVINKLRVMFAEISVGMLSPDLVIMDEFQRFKFIIKTSDESDTGILARKFLNSDEIRILLLSATPYKLYSTLEEIDENQIDEHYSEFFEVMEFLLHERKKKDDFKKVWSDYSITLHEMKSGDTAIISVKQKAEDILYGGVCRTERISVMETGDYTDVSSTKKHLKIDENDIMSYLEAGNLLKEIEADFTLPVDYAKSCPYLLSFMRNYKVKERIEKYFKKHPKEVAKAKKQLLWMNKNLIDRYEELPKVNARLDSLKEHAFQNKSELYLWVPPSKPYYEMQGVYKNSKGFSKILVFSAWEMVPRMIGAMISYEAERRTVGKLSNQIRNTEKKNTNYFAESSKRFPVARLRFNVSNDEVHGMSLFNLLYPSNFLTEIYNPIDCMNSNLKLGEIERLLANKISDKLKLLKSYQTNAGQEDKRWYYMAPMLFDGSYYVHQWMDSLKTIFEAKDEDDITSDSGNKGYRKHLEKLEDYISAGVDINLGKMPEDLISTLVNMTLGSPAVCIYRANGCDTAKATTLAKVFLNRFNTTEGTAIIDLAYGKCKEENTHWKNVIKYCKDGNFQSMFDEYIHLLSDSVGFSEEENKSELIYRIMMESLKIHSATYTVDTYPDFKNRVEGNKAKTMKLRSHYAVGFTKGEGDDAKKVNRKESIRNAFNSPLRPFVLATTSIGQEGLDFHNYCRKIMHWNLPSNPIDLEQREGRINRFKCLAIRQNIAEKYGEIQLDKNIWREMFIAASEGEKQQSHSDLVPYWCMGKNQNIKIERIVPMYPMSKDGINYERLIKVLSLYRLTMGQARQEELLEYLFSKFDDSGELKKLFINLCPFSKERVMVEEI
jgi:hypothetical protein